MTIMSALSVVRVATQLFNVSQGQMHRSELALELCKQVQLIDDKLFCFLFNVRSRLVASDAI